jgi:hypothetical protein
MLDLAHLIAESLLEVNLIRGRSCYRSIRPRFSMGFLGPRANAEFVSKFRVALHASRGVFPMVTLKISP